MRSLEQSRSKVNKPVLRSGFKTAYDSTYEKFLSDINESDLKNMNTVKNINGKNFHMFQSIRRSEDPPQKETEKISPKEIGLEKIKEESSHQYTIRQTLNSQPSRNNLSFRQNHPLRFDSRQKKPFLTGTDSLDRRYFLRGNDPAETDFLKKHKMNSNPEFLKKLKLTERNFKNIRTMDDRVQSERDNLLSGKNSLSVTNNEITNNNHNVNINNKMNTFIIIMNDQKQQEQVEKNFSNNISLSKSKSMEDITKVNNKTKIVEEEKKISEILEAKNENSIKNEETLDKLPSDKIKDTSTDKDQEEQIILNTVSNIHF